ncbi:hypothetical protein ACW73L_07680 [Methylolobus aquaticus]
MSQVPQFCIRLTLIAMLQAMALWSSTVGAVDSTHEVRAYTAYVNKAGMADWLVPDYVVKFRVPKGTRWGVYPKTERARTAFNFGGQAAHGKAVGDAIEIIVVAGGRARRAAGYGRRDAWEYANELRAWYRN